MSLIERPDGWVSQVVKSLTNAELAGESGTESRSALTEQLQSEKNKIEDSRDRLAKLKKEANPAKQPKIDQLETRFKRQQELIAKIQKQIDTLPPEKQIAISELDLSDDVLENTITEAYLRTLSRKPTESELNRVRQHLDESPSLRAGLRDLIWALINTKEFIVNR
ncbi:MAG: hypothetical protein SGJ20_20175 [Planctomycetota bacterium]|nr:hypothetical protein [Planctomycetota bacterium]